jgi:hypothetical protein
MSVDRGYFSFLPTAFYSSAILEAKNRTLNDITSFVSMKRSNHVNLPAINFTNKFSINCFDELALITVELYNNTLIRTINFTFLVAVSCCIGFTLARKTFVE